MMEVKYQVECGNHNCDDCPDDIKEICLDYENKTGIKRKGDLKV